MPEPMSSHDEANASRVARDAIVIVLTGVVLGLGFNYFGLAGRPARGLPWLAAQRAPLESLETMTGDSAAHTGAPGTSTPEVVPTGSSSGTAPANPPAGSTTSPASASGTARGTSVKPPVSTNPPPTASKPAGTQTPNPASTAGSSSKPPASLPTIPVSDRPLKVELATVKKFFDAKAAVIVDAREAAEYAQGHIPGAVNIPIDEAGSHPEWLERLNAGEGPIIVYCGGGDCEASMMLAEALIRDYKKRRVLVYEGGFPEWASGGNPVSKGGGS